LGSAIRACGLFPDLLAPTSSELDISDSNQVRAFLAANEIDLVIHCAAMARLVRGEQEPVTAINTNIIGTANLVAGCLELNERTRFVHISTDAVYQGLTGSYSETGPTIPATRYGWSKLGAEAAVRMLTNHCVIRTRFFDPDNIPVNSAAEDMYTSKIPVADLVAAIFQLGRSSFVGVVNVGAERESEFNRNRRFRGDTRACKREDIEKEIPFSLPADSSMDVTRWRGLLLSFSKAGSTPKND
jgi:dTDP-4-dehydrorhamnose reductase